MDVVKNTKQMVQDIKSDYANKVKKIVVDEIGFKLDSVIGNLKNGIIDDFQKQVKEQFRVIFEDELMPFCEKVISEGMQKEVEKLGKTSQLQ